MVHIVTSTYRYERPPSKRKAVALAVPAIVTSVDPTKLRRPAMRRKAVQCQREQQQMAKVMGGDKSIGSAEGSRQSTIIAKELGAVLARFADQECVAKRTPFLCHGFNRPRQQSRHGSRACELRCAGEAECA